MLASLNSVRFYVGPLIASHHRSICLVPAGISDAVSSIPSIQLAVFHVISKMYFSRWELPGVSERMWSVNLEASISGEYQTL
jgi:hypothetical protein